MRQAVCDRHPETKLKLLKKPPQTASREMFFDGEKYKRNCDLYNYWQCPACKVCYATAKES